MVQATLSNGQFGNPVPVANGGTGAPGGAAALNNLLPGAGATPGGVFKVVGNNIYLSELDNNKFSPTGGVSQECTSRGAFKTKNAISKIMLVFANEGAATASEAPGPNQVIGRSSIEYPAGTSVQWASLNGQAVYALDPNAGLTFSDPMGYFVPAATTFYVRDYRRVAMPPASPAAAVVGSVTPAGSLAPSQQYFYKITTFDLNGIESGPTAEVSATTGLTTLAINLTWTANPNATAYGIYRSTTTSNEVLVEIIPAGPLTTGCQDNGSGQLVSTKTPPAAQKFAYTFENITGNSVQTAGSGSDLTGSTGALPNAGPTGNVGTMPLAVLGDDVLSHPLMGLGDSIQASLGLMEFAAANQFYINAGWFPAGLISASFPNFLNMSIGGTKAAQLTNDLNGMRERMAMTTYVDYILSNLGHNDISAGATWQSIATAHLTFAQLMVGLGKAYYVTDLTPFTTSTNNWSDVAGQTVTAQETARNNYNTWCYNGLQVDGSSLPVLTGGTKTPYIAGYFPQASAVEVNASNVLTQNGGFWRASAASAPFTLSGTQTATLIDTGSASWTVNTQGGTLIKMTSGTQNDNYAYVSANFNTHQLTLAANGAAKPTGSGNFPGLTGAPAAGDTFVQYSPYVIDGTHPLQAGHAAIAAAFATWVAANLAA